ncbi:hypothetical protein [Acidithiobacillus ferrooxidans]|uniref:hypothetical protein n=1 Tax=Acidithiobacillus ferrooxidans TaxID=920 RepID=UPI000B1C98CB|nr:hypothetical protein [Acidithiobacillus ferrooxidans]
MSAEHNYEWHLEILLVRLTLWMTALGCLMEELGGECYSIRLAVLLFVACLFGMALDLSDALKDQADAA